MLIVRNLQQAVLSPVSFTVGDGECLAVQGPSGSGKTLLLRAIADLDPNQGEVFLDDRPRSTMPGPEWRRQVIFLPAETGWWSDYVREHFADWNQAAPLIEALHLPIESRDWTVQRLSTGERQRLALVRALILRPRVLLLDEPTSGLDQETTHAVERLIGDYLNTGASALWVTHAPEQAQRLARRCLFLENGRAREETFA